MWAPQPFGWASLPADLLLQVEACLDDAEALASMRSTCAHWRSGLTEAPARLRPLGKPTRLAAFPRALELDYSARGGGQALSDGDLSAACTALGGRLQRLSIGGAFQLTPEGLAGALRACPALRHLAADGSTLQDAAFACLLAPPGAGACSSSSSGSRGSSSASSMFGACTVPSCTPLQQLEVLSLRGCLFLRGSLLADLAAACPRLASLDLAGCGLGLHLNPGVAALLPRLTSLQRLVLDGNQADDAAVAHAAALPQLSELSLRFSEHLTDAGLRELARLRGSTTLLARSSSMDGGELANASAGSSSASSSSSSSSSSGSSRDVGLVALDVSGCAGLTDGCWVAFTEMQGLTSLRMEHLPHLLQFPSMPEALPPLLWRLPRLRRLSLAGSCCHPSKLKLLGAACGGTVTHLDLSTGGGSGCACCRSAAAGGAASALPPGPPYRRLTSLHERDLCEAAASFRQLRCFRAGGSALPLRVCTAFLAAVPAGRLQAADLSGCCLDAETPAAEAAYARQSPWQRQLCFSSGARRALNFDELPRATGNSVSRLQQAHTEAEGWQRPATAGRFASALRRQGASLRVLRLGGTSGLKDRHLSSLRALCALQVLCLAGTGAAAVSPTLLADAAAGCPSLHTLHLGGTAANDGCLAAAAAMPALRHLDASGCASVGAAGVAALAAGPAARSLRWLDLSQTAADDAAVAALSAGCRQLRGVQLTGCSGLTPAAVEQLCRLPRLESLSLGRQAGRCPQAVTDAGLQKLALSQPQLTRLGLSESRHLSAAGLAAALPLLPVLALLDLTACSGGQLSDDQLLEVLACGGSGTGDLHPTAAHIQLPQGGSSPTGSPFRRRRAGMAA